MSIVDNIRIKQDWDPTGEKGGYKIDYNYQEPEEPEEPADAGLSVAEKLTVFDNLKFPKTLDDLRRNILKILQDKILTTDELAASIKRVLGDKKKLNDIRSRKEGDYVWRSIDDTVEDKYRGLALRPPARASDAGFGESEFLSAWTEQTRSRVNGLFVNALPTEEAPGSTPHDKTARLPAGYSAGWRKLNRIEAGRILSFVEELEKRGDGDL